MTSSEITEYLKRATDLESSVYRQEQMIKACNTDRYIPTKKTVYAPSYYPSKPNPPKDEKGNEINSTIIEKKKRILKILIGFLGGFAFCALFSIIANDSIPIIVFLVTITIIAFIVSVKLQDDRSTLEAKYAKYQNDLMAYETSVNKIDDDYYRRSEEANVDYQSKMKIYSEKKALADDEISKLQITLQQTKSTLERLYSFNVIFPKYRNLIAMCSMYEYFASGRCAELTGPNGAYNLYEAELRQNIIISKLDVIITQLEQIKQNQYILYSEMQKNNQALNTISSDMNILMKTAKNIELNTFVTSQCAQNTAINTEALKYINLING